MVTLRKAAQQALEALEYHRDKGIGGIYTRDVCENLRSALAEQDTFDFETLRRYALEAGIVVTTDTPAQEENARKCFGKFAALVAAAEREECAKVCEQLADKFYENDQKNGVIKGAGVDAAVCVIRSRI